MTDRSTQPQLDQCRRLLDEAAYAEAASLLTELAEPLFWHGQTQTFLELFEQIPIEERNTFPYLLIAAGDAWRIRSDFYRAGSYYQQVLQGQGGINLAVQACSLCRHALLSWRRGDVAGAIELYEQAQKVLNQLQAQDSVWDDFNSGYALALSSLGKLDQAEQLLQHQLRAFQRRADVAGQRMMLHNLGIMIYLRRGDFQAAEAVLREGLHLARESNQQFGEAYMLNSLAYVLNWARQSAEALHIAMQAQALGEKLAAPNVIAYAYFNQAQALFHQQLFEASKVACQHALTHTQSALSTPLRADVLLMQAQLQQHERILEASQTAQTALAAGRIQGDLWTVGLCLLLTADLFLNTTKLEQAYAAVAEAQTIFEQYSDRFQILRCHILAARIAFAQDNLTLLKHHVQMLLAPLYHYSILAAQITDCLVDWIVALVLHYPQDVEWLYSIAVAWDEAFASVASLLINHQEEQVRMWTVTVLVSHHESWAWMLLAQRPDPSFRIQTTIERALEQAALYPLPPLGLSCFGQFSATHDGIPIPEERWNSLHAQLIVVYIALRGPTTRDQLIDLLWPDENLEKTGVRLRSTLLLLRKVLRPPWLSSSNYIVYQNERYKFDPNVVVTTDVQQFQHWIRLARQQRPGTRYHACAQALTYYTGEFLSGWYHEWVLSQREQLATDWLWAQEEYTEGLLVQGKLSEAEDYARQIVTTDPFRERAWQLLLNTLRQQGRPAEAMQVYKSWAERLNDEFGLEPTLETKRVMGLLDKED